MILEECKNLWVVTYRSFENCHRLVADSVFTDKTEADKRCSSFNGGTNIKVIPITLFQDKDTKKYYKIMKVEIEVDKIGIQEEPSRELTLKEQRALGFF